MAAEKDLPVLQHSAVVFIFILESLTAYSDILEQIHKPMLLEVSFFYVFFVTNDSILVGDECRVASVKSLPSTSS